MSAIFSKNTHKYTARFDVQAVKKTFPPCKIYLLDDHSAEYEAELKHTSSRYNSIR